MSKTDQETQEQIDNALQLADSIKNLAIAGKYTVHEAMAACFVIIAKLYAGSTMDMDFVLQGLRNTCNTCEEAVRLQNASTPTTSSTNYYVLHCT